METGLSGQLAEFWQIVVDVWTDGVYGIDIGRILTAAAILIGFLLLRGLLTRVVIAFFRRAAERTETKVDDALVEAAQGPLSTIPIALGLFFTFQYLGLTGDIAVFAERVVRSVIVIIIFWAIYGAMEPISALIWRLRTVLTGPMISWIIRIMKAAVIFLGITVLLETWGIAVAPLLAGLGLFGVAVALGAQDMFKNLLAGFAVILERRFVEGDWIQVEGVVEGTVETIGFRSTKVRRFDKAPVYVPNSALSDAAVTNFSAMTHRRIYWKIGVVYGTSIDQLRTIRQRIEDYLMASKDFAKPPDVPTFVRIDSFSDSSIDILLYCFTVTTRWGEWLEIKEELALAIKAIVEEEGSGFAFPSRSLYVEAFPAGRPEIFVPPGPGGAAAEGSAQGTA